MLTIYNTHHTNLLSLVQVRSFTSDTNTQSVIVEVTFEVKFIQSTIFRYMIDSSTTIEVQKWFTEYFAHIKQVCEEYKLNPESSGIDQRLQELRAAAGKQTMGDLSYDTSMSSSTSNIISSSSSPLSQEGKDVSSLIVSFTNTLVKSFQNSANVIIQSVYGMDYKDRVIIGLLLVLTVLIMHCIQNAVVLKHVQSSIHALLVNQLNMKKELDELQQCRQYMDIKKS